jgi:anaerobic selenocysteine-containing dehydrogenase
MDEIAARLDAILSEHGPRAIASFSGTAAYANSGSLPVVRAWHRGIGSTSNYSTLTIDQPAKIVATARHGVWGAGGHSFASSDVALSIGNNPLISKLTLPGGIPGTNPAKSLDDARRRGLKLICVDPRRSEVARRAHLHLQVRPGEDATLLAGMLRVILEEDLHDADFCRDHTTGLAELKSSLAEFTPDYVARRSGVPAEQMIEAARLFAAGPRGYASSGTGPDMGPHPTLTEHLIVSLNSLCGRHLREGEPIPNPGVLALPVPRPAQAIPKDLLPPILHYGSGPEARFRDLRQMFEEMPSTTLAEEILTPGEGQIRALIVVGANPLLAMPDPLSMQKALFSLELLVCVDVALSATARHAHYVISARHALEREDVTEFMDPFYEVPYAHYSRAVVEPEGDSIEDWELFVGLARRMGSEIELPGGPVDVRHPLSKLELLQLIRPATRVPLARLREQPGGRIYEEIALDASAPLPGIEALLAFAPEGVCDELRALRAEGFEPRGRYTHRLICRRLDHVVNSVGPDFPESARRGRTNPAFMAAEDLAELGVAPGELVEIESQHGSLLAVAQPTDEVEPGVVSIAHCFGDASLGSASDSQRVRASGSNTGLLVAVDRDYDPITGMARQSAVPVAVRAVDPRTGG